MLTCTKLFSVYAQIHNIEPVTLKMSTEKKKDKLSTFEEKKNGKKNNSLLCIIFLREWTLRRGKSSQF
jgi:hypothetical protein